MKKILLFGFALGLAFSLNAQDRAKQQKESLPRLADGKEAQIIINHPKPLLNSNVTKAVVDRIVVGTATGQRALRREEARLVTYNPDLNMISVILVAEEGVYPGITANGTVVQFYSLDEGNSWEGPVVLNNDNSLGVNYYISGTIYNPAGNSDVNSAVGVYQGTIYPTTGDWKYKAFGSSTYSGENQMNYLFEETNITDYPMGGYFNFLGTTQVNNEVRCLNILPTGAWSSFTELALTPQVGTFNGTEFQWDVQGNVDMELTLDEGGLAQWEGRYQGRDGGVEIAWSPDGMTGYMWVIGISDNDFSGYQPVLYSTTDGGENWDYVYLDLQTTEAQVMLEEITPANWTGARIPRFVESCGVVNMNGDLELFGNVQAHSADIFNSPDSLGWGWVYPGDVVNFTINTNGELLNVIYVDSLLTENVLDTDDASINYAGNSGWQHRMQASRNNDGSQVFVTWTDTRNPDVEKNQNPDLFGWSKGLCDNADSMDPFCITEGTLYETFYYFTSSADLAYANGDGYTIPTIQGVTPGEFSTNTNAANNPITINYITGVEFPDLCHVGIAELETKGAISVAQNQPNPFTGTTTIQISSKTVAPVSVEVANMLGQVVYTQNAGTINGTMNVELNASQLEAGVYFYTVRVGADSVTKKMIVE